MALRPGDTAWLALAAGVVAWEIAGAELLSEAVDRYLEAHPWLTRAVIAIVALHLANLLPERLDPLHQIAVAARRGVDQRAPGA